MFFEQLINGLILGSIYALCALGFTLIFGVARVVNFAYGELLMLGAFTTLTLTEVTGLGYFAALPIAMLVVAAVSVLVYVLAVRPVMHASPLRALLATTGVLYVLREIATFIWGTAPRQLDMGFEGALEVGDIVITYQRVTGAVVMLVMVAALYWMLYRTKIGKALRAVAQNPAGAQAIGLNTDRVIAFAFAVSGAMACTAGALIGSLYATEPAMGGSPLLKSFVIVIFGGLGSVPGAIAGGLAIGLLETMSGAYVSYAFKDVFTFLIMIAVLLWRPAGLLGKRIA